MTPSADTERDKNHRFPGEIISHGLWLYYRFSLSYREVQELLMERGIDVSHESIRKWCGKFGQDYANQLCRHRPQPGDKWHLDEVFLTIHGERYYLWRAVDQDDNGLDVLVQSRPSRQRERHMQGCKSPGHAQRFLSVYGPISQHSRPRRHLLRAGAYRLIMAERFEAWRDVTGLVTAA